MSLVQTNVADNDLSLWGLDELIVEPVPPLQQTVAEPPRKRQRATNTAIAKHVSTAERNQNSSSSIACARAAHSTRTTTDTANANANVIAQVSLTHTLTTTTHAQSTSAAATTTNQDDASVIDLAFLRQRESKVLHADEVLGVLHLRALRDDDGAEHVRVATERHRNICDYFGDAVVRCYAGLTRYDSAHRLQHAMDALQSLHRDNSQILCSAYAKNDSEHVKNQLKRRHKMLADLTDHYRSFSEYAHFHAAENAELKRKIAAQRQRFQRQRIQGSEFAYLGRLRENAWLNPVSIAMARGHSLSRANVQKLTRLKHCGRGASSSSASSSSFDASLGYNEQALLGDSGACPPNVCATVVHRTKSNPYLGRFNDNMRILYGADAAHEFDTRNLRYRAHCLQEHFCEFQRLGSGVYGCVFRARTKRTNVTVAIKIVSLLKPEQSIEKEYAKHVQQQTNNQHVQPSTTTAAAEDSNSNSNQSCPFMPAEGVPLTVVREITALKQLNHVNVTRLYDVLINDARDRYEVDDDELRKVIYKRYDFDGAQSKCWTFHLVQEYVPNELGALIGNLREIHFDCMRHTGNLDNASSSNLNNPDLYRLTPQQMQKDIKWFTQAHIKSMMHDLLSGLQFLKVNKYIHRDLKPQNLLLTDDGRVKIADFGLSRAYNAKVDKELTNGGHVVTRYYRAPEILLFQSEKRSEYAFASDMWSIGCIFGELIQGRPVFRGEDDFTQLYWIQHKCGPMTADTMPGWPKYTKTNGAKIQEYVAQKKISSRYEGGARPHIVTETEKFTPMWPQHGREAGLDLLTRMLTYDPSKRITPDEALQHEWFVRAPSIQAPKKFIQEIRRAKKQSHSDLQKTQQLQQQHKQQKLLLQQQQLQQQQQRKQNSLPPSQPPMSGGRRHGQHSHARQPQQQLRRAYTTHGRANGHASHSMNNLHHVPPPRPHSQSRNGGNNRRRNQQLHLKDAPPDFAANAREAYLRASSVDDPSSQSQRSNKRRLDHL